MKKFVSKQKNCFWVLLSLILVCEILFMVDNIVIQSLGIILTPLTVVFGVLLMKNDEIKK